MANDTAEVTMSGTSMATPHVSQGVREVGGSTQDRANASATVAATALVILLLPLLL